MVFEFVLTFNFTEKLLSAKTLAYVFDVCTDSWPQKFNDLTILFNHLINGFGIRFDILFHGKVIVSQDACMCL